MKACLTILALAFGLLTVTAQERVTLTTPIQVVVSPITDLSVRTLILHRGDPATPDDDRVIIDLNVNENTPGATLSYDRGAFVQREIYDGQPAATMIVQLNKVNLATRSLLSRICDRLVADGRIAGTCTGAPQ